MPPKDLPEQAKKIYMAAEESARKTTCKDEKNIEECVAKVAWSAIKNAGWVKVDGEWKKKSLIEFSLYITKASFDKKTQEMRFQAVASDTDEDGYNDNMTSELFDTFLERIESKEEPPGKYKSDYWKGGTPYLSLAHYLDLNGKAVPGTVDSVYKDGNRLKAKGRFSNNALGRACFNNICADLYDEKRSDADDKIRISIAFLDYKHEHKSNGELFERKSIDDVCPDCVKETITKILSGKMPQGKKFLDGHLIHLALTRVPVNERTGIIVERSMKTQKEDALSIVGEENEELIDEIENELSSVTKSEALVVKAKKEKAEAEEEDDDKKEEEDEEDEDEKKKKKESSSKENKSDALTKDEVREMIKEFVKESVPAKPEPVTVESHPLDEVLAKLKSTYDNAIEQKLDPNATLLSLQEPMEMIGRAILDGVKEVSPTPTPDPNAEIMKAITELTSQVALLKAQQASPAPQTGVPQRRGITPDLISSQPNYSQSETPKLQSIVRKSVGLSN